MLHLARSADDLFERDHELEVLADGLDSAAAGRGSLVVILGPAGIGKTSLLQAAAELALGRGLRSLAARGGELEQSFAYGCVRQLFEREVRGGAGLEGAAALAGPALGQQAEARGAAAHDAFAIHHGLYWLTVDLATAAGGLLLAIDDAHWCDRATLEWIRYLGRRLDDVPTLVILAVRAGEPQSEVDLIDALTVEPSTRLARPSALTGAGVEACLLQTLGDANEAVVGACRQASGGNPFLLKQLVITMREQSDRSRDALIATAHASTPETVVRAIVVRLRRLGDDAVALAQAVAVLGAAAQSQHAASLGELDQPRAAAALDVLVAADVVTAAAPLTFVHPLVWRAVYEAIPFAERSLMHSRAARVLSRADVPAELIAGQLLACSPAGDTWAVDVLRTCAAEVLARAPEAAVRYLIRALQEPPLSSACVALGAELGRAELLSGDAGAVEHLRAAVEQMEPGPERVALTTLLARAVLAAGGMAESVEWFERAAKDALTFDQELARECEVEILCIDSFAPKLDANIVERAREYAHGHALDTAGGRMLLALMAQRAAMEYEPASVVRDLADAALGDGTLVDHMDERFIAFNLAAWAAISADWFEIAAEQATRVLELGSAGGRPRAFVAGSHILCAIRLRQGRVWEAEAHGWDAVRFIDTLPVMRAQAVLQLVDALLARGAVVEAGHLLDGQGLSGEGLDRHYANRAFVVRAKWHRAAGRLREALDDLTTCAKREEMMGRARSACIPWRSEAALAHRLLGEHDKARQLAQEEVDLTRAFGAPGQLGIALRALGLAWRADAIEHLRESVEALEVSPLRLELATSLVELGAALRRHHRRDAIPTLRRGLDLAARCGGSALADRARAELNLAGARPRRDMITGRDALTATERRVAELAASGCSNRAIAQAQFVSLKTVETHLGHVYQKLGIGSRQQLAAALQSAD